MNRLLDSVYWSLQLERLKLFLFEIKCAHFLVRKSPVDQSVDTLVNAEHICPRCRFLDGTSCLFSLDVGYDKVIRCHEFEEPKKITSPDVESGF